MHTNQLDYKSGGALHHKKIITLQQPDLMSLYKMQLSANKRYDDDKLSEMSFMYVKNSNGPSTLPCGTPIVTSIGLEKEPPHMTR